MKNKWLWISVGLVCVFVLVFMSCAVIALLFRDNDTKLVKGSGIGVVEVKGVILDSQETVKQLHDFGRDDDVKAVVLRVDSPGGVVGPSQEIYQEVKKLAKKKKVVVSMGSLAASGGYYISAPASLIYANPGSITGSIGVLMKFSNVEGLMDKIGMKAFTLKTGKYKDSGSPVRPMTAEEKALLQGVIESTHGQFVKAVSEGRNLPVEQVKAIADGRIFSGEQALAARLVDRLGSMQDAIEEAGRLAGIKGEPEVIRPPKKKKLLLDMLVEESASRISNLVREEIGMSVSYEMAGVGGK
ncbi:putative protease [Geobacter sp. OR-1]|uniref:signal peptide peptidase SppA n=1 Tax=Geobacter sp. OR-1 TaxID=1266765 RepID=UPI00054388B6|nr:signal peptide peptidase SppA [Geobacter sp. OR-1]GAM11056.1 putative protease [Geobacter sp. OR-1]